MPPKAKFSKAEIVEAALAIVRADGFQTLTARALGAKLNSSARPIFTVFESMEEVQQAVLAAAKECYAGYVERGLATTPAFKGVGTQYILFAIQEPKLFQLLFMAEQEHIPPLSGVLPVIEQHYSQILQSVRDAYDVSEAAAKNLYQHLWIYSHGIAALCATKVCQFTGGQISGMLTEVFVGLLKNVKEGDAND